MRTKRYENREQELEEALIHIVVEISSQLRFHPPEFNAFLIHISNIANEAIDYPWNEEVDSP